jgi:carbon-monoxide dehydrogenase iron sulfur subunit
MAKEDRSTAVVVVLERCLACRSCEMACAKAHARVVDIVEAVLSGARLVPRVRVIAAAGRAVPVQCQHCEDAPCVVVCPSGALYREEETGRVLARVEKCIGCKSCVVVCPFGAVEWDRASGSVVKCDLCAEIIEAGEEPSCVVACPTHARRVVVLRDLAARRRREVAERTVKLYESESGAPKK